MIRLIPKQKSVDVLCLVPHNGFRLVFVVICLILAFLIGGDFFQSDRGSNAVLFVLLFVCLSAACYQEKWIFDRGREKIERHFGFIFLFKRKVFPLKAISYFTVSHFVRCRPELNEDGPPKKLLQKDYATLALITHDGRMINLEITRGRQKAKLIKTARHLAAFCSKPLR